MSQRIKISLTKIGNSQGFIIPKKILSEIAPETCNNFMLEVKNNKLVITAESNPREGWEEAFKNAGPDELLIPDPNDIQ